MKPQSASILRMLREHPEGVTPRMALVDAGCMRLAARVADLRADGFAIEAELVTVRTGSGFARVARYRLIETEQLRIAI